MAMNIFAATTLVMTI